MCLETWIKICINHGSVRFEEIVLFIFSNSSNLIPHIVLVIPRLPDTIQKSLCTADGAMDPTFHMK